MKVAFVHDWLVTYRGGEKVLEQLLDLYPTAPIYTLFYRPEHMPASIRSRDIRYPRALAPFWKVKTALLPLFPSIIESFNLDEYDLIISTSSCVAKGVIPSPDALHLCYLHSPMRYIWDQRSDYIDPLSKIPGLRPLANYLSTSLRIWDASSSHRVDRFVVNSTFVKKRVHKYYGKGATVVHPPVDYHQFAAAPKPEVTEPYFLTAGAFVPYKRLDIAINACASVGVKLVVAGSGPLEHKLRSLGGTGTKFVIKPSVNEWINLFRGARAFLFPAVEDFGITAMEAMSSGVPVLAYKAGGALDFIKPGVTGEFFTEQTSANLAALIKDFNANKYDRNQIQSFAERFDQKHFIAQMTQEIDLLIKGRLP